MMRLSRLAVVLVVVAGAIVSMAIAPIAVMAQSQNLLNDNTFEATCTGNTTFWNLDMASCVYHSGSWVIDLEEYDAQLEYRPILDVELKAIYDVSFTCSYGENLRLIIVANDWTAQNPINITCTGQNQTIQVTIPDNQAYDFSYLFFKSVDEDSNIEISNPSFSLHMTEPSITRNFDATRIFETANNIVTALGAIIVIVGGFSLGLWLLNALLAALRRH